MSLRLRVVMGCLVAGFALLESLLAISRYASFHNRTFDLALYTRQAWGLARGDFWDPISACHFFGTHLAWVLWPLGVLGKTYGTAHVLLVAQALAIALATIPLAKIAARRFGDAGAGVATLAWLFYPNLGHVSTYEFHPGTLAVLPLALALDQLDRQRGVGFMLACLGVLACRADFAFSVALLGVVALLASRDRLRHDGAPMKPEHARSLRRGGATVLVIALAYLALSLFHLRPNYWPTFGSLDLHFGKWGGSPQGVVRALFVQPGEVLSHFTEPARLFYIFRIVAPLALLPLFAPRLWLAALPFVAINVISEFPTTTQLYSHYLTPAVPILLAATFMGLARLRSLATQLVAPRLAIVPSALVLLAFASVSASYFAGGLPWSLDFDASAFSADAQTAMRARVVASVPKHASVQAPDALLAQLAERPLLFRGPPPDRAAEHVVLDVSHRERYARTETLLRTTEEPLTRAWLARRDYGLTHVEPSYYVFSRGEDPRGGLAVRYLADYPGRRSAVSLCRCLWLLSAWLSPAGLELELFAEAPCPNDLALRIGTGEKPSRVDLLFDGLLSPAQLRDEYVISRHPLSPEEQRAIETHGLRIGALRSSGAPPEPTDPVSVEVPLIR